MVRTGSELEIGVFIMHVFFNPDNKLTTACAFVEVRAGGRTVRRNKSTITSCHTVAWELRCFRWFQKCVFGGVAIDINNPRCCEPTCLDGSVRKSLDMHQLQSLRTVIRMYMRHAES